MVTITKDIHKCDVYILSTVLSKDPSLNLASSLSPPCNIGFTKGFLPIPFVGGLLLLTCFPDEAAGMKCLEVEEKMEEEEDVQFLPHKILHWGLGRQMAVLDDG